MKKRGFTLIEFLVVAALLAIIMTIGLSTYQRSLSRGRDAKRVSDMKEVQKGFELYYATHNAYAVCATMFGDTDAFPRNEPSPPTGNFDYLSTCTTSTYWYCTGLENGSDYGNAGCTDTGLIGTCSFTNTPINSYCVTNVQ